MNRIRMSQLPLEDQKQVTAALQEKIRQAGSFKGRTPNDNDLHLAAAQLLVDMARAMTENGEEGGMYLSEEEAATLYPIILTSQNVRGRKYRRILAHEMSHHLMRQWVAPNLYGADEVICTNQDNGRVRHRIAQDVDSEVTE